MCRNIGRTAISTSHSSDKMLDLSEHWHVAQMGCLNIERTSLTHTDSQQRTGPKVHLKSYTSPLPRTMLINIIPDTSVSSVSFYNKGG